MKVLNLYAGIGGNRKLWENVEVTAVEINPKIARIYQEFFPNDKVIVADAHQYLLDHYKEFSFIWSSPPCQTHSRINRSYKNSNKHIKYPDMSLYQEVLFLNFFSVAPWVVENVTPYYKPLIKPQTVGRHCFWSNFIIVKKKMKKGSIGSMNGKYKPYSTQRNWYSKKPLTERNCVDPELGLHVFKCAFEIKQMTIGNKEGD